MDLAARQCLQDFTSSCVVLCHEITSKSLIDKPPGETERSKCWSKKLRPKPFSFRNQTKRPKCCMSVCLGRSVGKPLKIFHTKIGTRPFFAPEKHKCFSSEDIQRKSLFWPRIREGPRNKGEKGLKFQHMPICFVRPNLCGSTSPKEEHVWIIQLKACQQNEEHVLVCQNRWVS